MYKTIDNFIPKEKFKDIQEVMMSENFNWFFQNYVVGDQVSTKEGNSGQDDYFFSHIFFNKKLGINSPHYGFILSPIFKVLNADKIIRVKANLYINHNKKVEHGYHIDYPDLKHKVALFSINTNDGYTELENIGSFKSIENRMLIFDGDIKHRSVTQTDCKRRVNININYI
tara:strand:+ start:4745 stop:5257 length:513 start_codon:yes stop_codon:yes gene_type:complete